MPQIAMLMCPFGRGSCTYRVLCTSRSYPEVTATTRMELVLERASRRMAAERG